jgi:hypothetical protein
LKLPSKSILVLGQFTLTTDILVNMKEAIVHKGPVVEIVDSPIPEPGPDDVVTKVVVSGSNPKDW